MNTSTPQTTWTIGELAAACGLTVRALRHFEDKGLVTPTGRTSAGHRSYDRAAVERAYRVVALRGLGLPLARIAEALAAAPDEPLVDHLTTHLAQVEEQIAALTALRSQLQQLVTLDHPIPEEELMVLLRRTVDQSPLPPELLAEFLDEDDRALLAERGETLGEEGQRMLREDYPALYREAARLRSGGAGVTDPEVQLVAGRLEALGRQWGAPGTEVGTQVQQMWSERSAEITGVDHGDLGRFVIAARAHWRSQNS